MRKKRKWMMQTDERRLKTGGPVISENHGSYWIISRKYGPDEILVSDPGNGSNESLAQRIVELLNASLETTPDAP